MNNKSSKKSGFPVVFTPQLIQNKRFRFVCSGSAAAEVPIYVGCLRALLFGHASGTSITTNAGLIQAIRIKKVEMWAVATGGPTAFTTCSLIWKGLNSPITEYSATGDNVRPAYLSCVPPPLSEPSWWHDQASAQGTELFELSCPIGTVVDVVLDYVLHDGANASTITTVSGVTAVGIFAANLDCLAANMSSTGTNVLVPVGLEQIGANLVGLS